MSDWQQRKEKVATPKFLPKIGTDWCHLCGVRSSTTFIEFNVPYNAEHDIEEPARLVRLCAGCIGLIAVELHTKQSEGSKT
jgi:hypothetical protein